MENIESTNLPLRGQGGFFQTQAQIETLVAQFMDKSLPLEAWTHEAHLAMGVWFLRQYTLTESMLLVRQHIISYNLAAGGSIGFEKGYHETLTWFWLKTVDAFLERFGRKKALLETCNAFLESEFAQRDRALLFYKREEVFSLEARAFLLMPTNTSLDF